MISAAHGGVSLAAFARRLRGALAPAKIREESPALLETPAAVPDKAPDEDLLLEYARTGERAALDRLVERRWPEAYRICLGVLRDPGAAEDAAQEAFVALVRSAARFEAGRSFGGWFHALVLNAARTQVRSRGRRRRHEAEAAQERPDLQPGGEGERRLDRELLAEHLDQLPIEVRFPIVLHYYEGCSHEDVAQALSVPRTTARARIRRGLELLRESLAGAGHATSLAALEETFASFAASKATTPLPPRPSAHDLERLAGGSPTPPAPRGLATGLSFTVLALALGAGLAWLGMGSHGAGAGRASDVALVSSASSSSSNGTGASSPDSSAIASSADEGSADANNGEASPLAPTGTAAVGSQTASSRFHALSVHGRVVTRDGHPVAGATVVLRMELGSSAEPHAERDRRLEREGELEGSRIDPSPAGGLARALFRAVHVDNRVARATREQARGASAADGSYRLTIPPERFVGQDTFGHILVTAESAAEHGIGSAQVPFDDEIADLARADVELDGRDLALRLVSHATIAVRRDGHPVADARVDVYVELTTVHPEDKATSDRAAVELRTRADGTVELDTDSRTLLVSAQADGDRPSAPAARTFVIDSPAAHFTIDLEEPATITVDVVDKEGHPVPKTLVDLKELTLQEDTLAVPATLGTDSSSVLFENTRMVFDDLRRGATYRITARPDDFHAEDQESPPVVVTAPGAVTIVLDGAPRGRLEVSALFAPVPDADKLGAACELERLDPKAGRFVWYRSVDLEKAAGAANVPAGTYRARVTSDLLAGALSTPVEVKAGEPARIELALGVGRSVSGSVLGPGGAALDAWIRPALRPSSELPTSCERDGRFTVALVPEGDTQLTFGAPGFEEKTVRVPAGVSALETVTLTPATAR